MSVTEKVPSGVLPNSRAVSPPPIPDHQLLCQIGRGSYGEVWLARNVLGECRAVKIVYRGTFESARPFEREFEGIKKFEPLSRSHESQVQILHVGRAPDESCFYYIMELADDASGAPANDLKSLAHYRPKTLRCVLEQSGRLSPNDCIEIALKLTRALAHLHQHGLVHRDVKPSNIIFVRGIPKLADIGLVAKADATLSFVGTEGFLPPEGPGKPQADLYSLGKVLYEACTGRDRQDFPELPTQLRSLPERERLAELNEIITKACEPDPARRYLSAEQMFEDLLLLQAGKSLKRLRAVERRLKNVARAAVVLLVLATIVAVALVIQRSQTKALAAERNRAERALGELELLRISELLDNGEANTALMHLARALREHPAQRFTAERTMAAINQQSFLLPVNGPFRVDAFVYSTSISFDGRTFAAAAADGGIRIWNSDRGEPAADVLWHDGKAYSVEFSPDGQQILSASDDHTARIWNWKSATNAALVLSHDAPVTSAKFSRDAQRILTVTGAQARLWNAITGTLIRQVHHKAKVVAAQLSPDGKFIGAALLDCTAVVWDLSDAKPVARVLKHDSHTMKWGGVTSIQFSPDSRRVLTAAWDNTARLWDVTTGTQVVPPLRHQHPVRGASFSPDGAAVLTYSNDRTACLWEATSGRPLAKLKHSEGVSFAEFSPDGRLVITREENDHRTPRHALRVWTVPEGKLVSERWLPGPNQITGISPDAHSLLAGSAGGFWLWRLVPGGLPSFTLSHSNWVGFAQFCPDNKKLVTTEVRELSTTRWADEDLLNPRTNCAALLWDLQTGTQLGEAMLHDSSIVSAQFSWDGKKLATASFDHTARIWDARTGLPLFESLRHPERVRFAKFTPDGLQLISSCWMHRAWAWDTSIGRISKELTDGLSTEKSNRSMPVRPDDLSRDGRWLVTGSKDGAQVWDLATGKALATRFAPGQNIRSARFAPDATRFIVATHENDASIWDIKSGKRTTRPLHHGHPVIFAAFSPDGKKVVTCSLDHTARVWDATTGQPLTKPLIHEGEVVNAQFSPDSRRLVTASWWDKAALIWDVETGLPLSLPLRHDHWVNYAEFSPDGRRIVSASRDRTAKVWEVPHAALPVPDWLPRLAEALAGRRLNSNGMPELVPIEQLVALREQLASSPRSDEYMRWAMGVLIDRQSQTAPSPSAPATTK